METRTEQAHTAKQHSTGFNGVLRRSCTHLFTFIYGTELLHPFGFGHYCSLELPAEAASMRERGSRLSVSQPAACLLGVVRAQGPRYGSPLSHSAVQCAWCGCRRRGGRATNHSGYHHLIMAEWSISQHASARIANGRIQISESWVLFLSPACGYGAWARRQGTPARGRGFIPWEIERERSLETERGRGRDEMKTER